jgi:hypothetical protein
MKTGGWTTKAPDMLRLLALFLVTIVAAAVAHAVALYRPLPLEPQNCRYSDALYKSDAEMMRHAAPTHLRLMPSRWVQIVEAARGKRCVGTVTVAFNGHEFLQTGRTDDAGIAELIPTLSSWTGLSLAQAFDLTVIAVIFLGLGIGYAGFWRMFPDAQLRLAGAGVFLLLGIAEITVANVYVFQSSPLIAGIPWVLYFAWHNRTLALNVSAALFMFCCACSSMVRIGTSLCCFVFLAILFLVRGPLRAALLSMVFVCAACLPVYLVNHSLIAHRNAILASLGTPMTAENGHTVWHSIYIGLSFIPNTDVPAYRDEVAADRVRAIDPTVEFTSQPYEAILRQEVLNLVKRRPMLILGNLVAKSTIVILLAAILLLPTKGSFSFNRQCLWIDAAFIAVMAVSSMNAILVIPRRTYLLTFFCVTSLYSVVKYSLGRWSRNIQPAAKGIDTRSAMAAFSRIKDGYRARR